MGLQLRKSVEERPRVIGHRGARGHAPENTMPSFRKALELGADWIELDVHITKDGRLVVIHDDSVDRTTDGSGLIASLTWDEIRHLDAGSWYDPAFTGAHIPLLEEVLEWARGRVPLIMEMKHAWQEKDDLVDRVVEAIRRHQMVEQVEVISFDHRMVRRVKELEPAISTGILYVAALADPIEVARAARADALHPQYSYVDGELVQEAHRAGLAVSPWVVNDPELARLLASWGVDSIGTDYPDRLVTAL